MQIILLSVYLTIIIYPRQLNLKISGIVVNFLFSCNLLFSQEILEQKVDPSLSNISIYDFFDAIETSHQVKFFYKKEWIKDIKTCHIKSGETLAGVLKKSLRDYKLSYIDIQGSNIILIPKSYNYFMSNEQAAFFKVIGNPMEKGKYRRNKVDGYVHFGKNGEPLLGVLVYDKKNNEQTITNKNGYYSIELPPGHTKLEFSFVGLETETIDIEILSHGRLDMEMNEAPIELEGVTVSAFSGKNNVDRAQMGIVQMDMQSLKKLPVLMGETDIIKSMTLLPGVNTTGELSIGFNVRGGNTDQNLVLLNNAPLYGTSHLFGLFSTLMPGTASSIKLHKGTQPANFGSRVSSVTEIKLKKADTANLTGKVGLGILNSSLLLEGPLVKKNISFIAGGRTTYSNWMLNAVNDINLKNSRAGFYDVIAKLDAKINDNNQLDIFTYLSNDNFKYSDINEYQYGSQLIGLNYTLHISNRSTLRTSLSRTSYSSEVSDIGQTTSAYTVKTGISQLNARLEADIYFNNNEITIGGEAIRYTLQPGIQTPYSDSSLIQSKSLEEEEAIEFAGFIHDVYRITESISISAGLRYSYYSKLGPATVATYLSDEPLDESTVTGDTTYSKGEYIKPYYGLEPRAGVKYSISENSSVKGGYSITRQYQHLISNTSSATPSDYWKSSDENIKPIISQQFSVGYFQNFRDNRIETSAEIYYKLSENVLDYKDGAVLGMNEYIEQELVQSNSQAYGLEIMIKKNVGRFTGWFSYTLSKSEMKSASNFKEISINNNQYYATYNDRLHDLSLSGNLQLTRRWTFSSNFIYSTGRPATFAENKYEFHTIKVVEFSDRNEYRLEPYHRLDIAFTYEGFLKKKSKLHPSFTFSVYNVYGRDNVYSVYYKEAIPSSENNYQQYGFYKLSVIGMPIPSLTLNLNF